MPLALREWAAAGPALAAPPWEAHIEHLPCGKLSGVCVLCDSMGGAAAQPSVF